MSKFEKSRIFFMLCGVVLVILANDKIDTLIGMVFLVANGLMFIYLGEDE